MIDSWVALTMLRWTRAMLILHDLLTEDGTLYVHMGWEVAPYVRFCLDEIFGRGNFVNQIIWRRQTAHSDIGQGAQHMGPIHDVILLYSKGDSYQWHMQYQPYSEDNIATSTSTLKG